MLDRPIKMWYASLMPKILPKEDIDAAYASCDYAQSVRRMHRRRSAVGSAQREQDIDVALERLRDAIAPIRSVIGTFPYGPQTNEAVKNREAVLAASDAIQRERRKLWKMKRRSNAEDS